MTTAVDDLLRRLPAGPGWTGPSGVLVLRCTEPPAQWVVGVGAVAGVGSGPPRWLRDKRLRPADTTVTGDADTLAGLLRERAVPAGATVDGDPVLLHAVLGALAP